MFHVSSQQQRLQKLHDSQLKAYTNAAQKALSDFAKTVKLPPVDLDVDEATYVDQVCKSLQVPEWNVNSKFVHIVVRKRAASLYHARQQEQAQMQNQKQQQTPIQQNYCENNDSKEHDTNLVDENNEDGTQMLNVTDDVDEGSGTGMDDTEDEEDDEDGEIVDSTVTGAKKLVKKNPRGNNINSSDNKKQQIKRKANSGKLPRLAMRGRKASSRGRGRGGGARGQARQA